MHKFINMWLNKRFLKEIYIYKNEEFKLKSDK